MKVNFIYANTKSIGPTISAFNCITCKTAVKDVFIFCDVLYLYTRCLANKCSSYILNKTAIARILFKTYPLCFLLVSARAVLLQW